ncbi:putative uncharacterized protein DDB_G0282133 isoform X3 [Gordionus sp. m RMFG-2023]|uniref:putative uncharacterized protein DDB_G0282133 isoform X3 n=1 Tax=Gordionus sp. m RMFG-2023 TaxID=3053472 RepID=UPI0031FD45CF
MYSSWDNDILGNSKPMSNSYTKNDRNFDNCQFEDSNNSSYVNNREIKSNKHKQMDDRMNNDLFTLFINKIPTEWTEDDLRKPAKQPDCQPFGFISYKTEQECYAAIDLLNNKICESCKPYPRLRVEISKSKNDEATSRETTSFPTETISLNDTNSIDKLNLNPGKKYCFRAQTCDTKVFLYGNIKNPNEILQKLNIKSPSENKLNNLKNNEMIDYNSNSLNPQNMIMEQPFNGYQNLARNNPQEYPPPSLNINNCFFCVKPALFTATCCNKAFYCSQSCNYSDWSRHKRFCPNFFPELSNGVFPNGIFSNANQFSNYNRCIEDVHPQVNRDRLVNYSSDGMGNKELRVMVPNNTAQSSQNAARFPPTREPSYTDNNMEAPVKNRNVSSKADYKGGEADWPEYNNDDAKPYFRNRNYSSNFQETKRFEPKRNDMESSTNEWDNGFEQKDFNSNEVALDGFPAYPGAGRSQAGNRSQFEPRNDFGSARPSRFNNNNDEKRKEGNNQDSRDGNNFSGSSGFRGRGRGRGGYNRGGGNSFKGDYNRNQLSRNDDVGFGDSSNNNDGFDNGDGWATGFKSQLHKETPNNNAADANPWGSGSWGEVIKAQPSQETTSSNVDDANPWGSGGWGENRKAQEIPSSNVGDANPLGSGGWGESKKNVDSDWGSDAINKDSEEKLEAVSNAEVKAEILSISDGLLGDITDTIPTSWTQEELNSHYTDYNVRKKQTVVEDLEENDDQNEQSKWNNQDTPTLMTELEITFNSDSLHLSPTLDDEIIVNNGSNTITKLVEDYTSNTSPLENESPTSLVHIIEETFAQSNVHEQLSDKFTRATVINNADEIKPIDTSNEGFDNNTKTGHLVDESVISQNQDDCCNTIQENNRVSDFDLINKLVFDRIANYCQINKSITRGKTFYQDGVPIGPIMDIGTKTVRESPCRGMDRFKNSSIFFQRLLAKFSVLEKHGHTKDCCLNELPVSEKCDKVAHEEHDDFKSA